jgi:hypothetical protein
MTSHDLEAEIVELGIFPSPPRILPDWLAKGIKKVKGKWVLVNKKNGEVN